METDRADAVRARVQAALTAWQEANPDPVTKFINETKERGAPEMGMNTTNTHVRPEREPASPARPTFRRAERTKTWIKIAMTGPSGSGKTYSALKLAFGLGQRVALLDTENGSGSLYAHLGEYDTCEITAPFTVEKYQQGIRDAAAAGYDVLIIDSLTHEWAGEGGLLAQKEALDMRGGNQFTNWASVTKLHEALKATILQSPLHIIATMRSKAEYVVDQADGRKAAPRKVGMAPIQRDGMEYEFTVVFDVQADHSAIATKDRTSLFETLNRRISEEEGRLLARWLESGAEPAPEPVAAPPDAATQRQSAEALMRSLLTQARVQQRTRADLDIDLARLLGAKLLQAEEDGMRFDEIDLSEFSLADLKADGRLLRERLNALGGAGERGE
jgi:hypothetical protein